MEKNKLDSSQIIGFLFLIAAFVSLYMFQPVVEEPVENNDTNTEERVSVELQPQILGNESLNYRNEFKVLENEFISIENNDVEYTFSTKGAQISKTILKNYNGLSGNEIEILNENQNFYFDIVLLQRHLR